jgi:hypothetical protein
MKADKGEETMAETSRIVRISDRQEKQEIARAVLEALPEWFEVEASR